MRRCKRIGRGIWIALGALVAVLTLGNPAYANLDASSASLSFGSQAVGSASSPQTVILTNNAKNRTSILSVSVAGAPFSVSSPSTPVTLYRGESLTVSVTFAPLAPAAYSGSLTIVSNNNGSVTVALSGTGTCASPCSVTNSIAASPSTLAFSVTAGGATPARNVTINDSTLAPLPFTVSADQPWISLGAASGTTQSGGTSLSVGVNVAGMSAGVYAGHVTLTASGVTNSPYTIAVALAINPPSPVPPSITSQPAGAKIIAGQTATFSVAATGTAPITYQWNKNGGAISGATSSSYTTPAETMADNSAQFTVSVSNSAGSANSNAAMLTVTNPVVAPAITAQPANATVTAGSTATFTVAASGTSPMSYQWSKNGGVIGGATSSSYTTPAETMSDNNAQFTVSVTNSAGSATSNAAVLTVNSSVIAPTITTQPASSSVIAGQTATFTVAATGTSPMTYQWSKNGGVISGATSSSYTTPAETTANNNAQFTVSVSNSAGAATSNAAVLTVNAATQVLNASVSSLSFGTVNVSASSSQNVTLTNAGNSNVTISNVTVTGAGFNAGGIGSGLILTPGQTATLTATFAPASAGSAAGNISVASNATNSPDSISLSGTGAAVVNHSVALSWTASTSSVMGYNTYSSTVSGGPYSKLTGSPVAATGFTDSTVQAGRTYYYVVTAVSSSNMESPYSPEVSATVP